MKRAWKINCRAAIMGNALVSKSVCQVVIDGDRMPFPLWIPAGVRLGAVASVLCHTEKHRRFLPVPVELLNDNHGFTAFDQDKRAVYPLRANMEIVYGFQYAFFCRAVPVDSDVQRKSIVDREDTTTFWRRESVEWWDRKKSIHEIV